MNSIKLKNRMDTIFMNSKISKISDPHKLLLIVTDKISDVPRVFWGIPNSAEGFKTAVTPPETPRI